MRQSKLPINLKLESSRIMATDQFAVSDQAASFDENRLKEQKEKVRRFRKRLQAREAFILPEIWDVVSARVMADAGFDLIGVSPDSVAWAQGLMPHERLPLDALVAARRENHS